MHPAVLACENPSHCALLCFEYCVEVLMCLPLACPNAQLAQWTHGHHSVQLGVCGQHMQFGT